MLERIGPGGVVTVTRIDRLACSTFDLFGIVKRIVDAKARFRSLAEPWADTGTSTGRLGPVPGGLADVERALIRTRMAEGRSRAKAQGKIWGGPFPHPVATERGHAAPRVRGHAQRTGTQLRRGHIHHSARDKSRITRLDYRGIQAQLSFMRIAHEHFCGSRKQTPTISSIVSANR
jgi:DNA invertase Pin-like site-specific DNA recombinase